MPGRARHPDGGTASGTASGALGGDLDGRADCYERPHPEDVAIRHAHASVRDGLPQQRRSVRAVDADDAAARPVRKSRVRARLEGEPPEDLGGRDEPPGDVEEAEWGL